MILTVYALLILILISALFSSGESALFSLNTTQKNQLISNQSYKKIRGKQILRWLEQPQKTLSAILLGNLTTNILIANLGYGLIDAHTSFSHLETSFIALTIITITLLVFAEIIPKVLALQVPMRWSLMLAPFLNVWFTLSHYFVQPIYYLMKRTTSWLPNPDKKYEEKELLDAILLASSYKLIKADETNTLKRSVIFHHDIAFQTMIPRSKVFMVPHNISTLKIKKAFLHNNSTSNKTTNFDDFAIVYHATSKKLLGYLHIKGLIVILHKKLKSITSKVQNILFLPQTIPLDQALKNMIVERIEVAAIVDESGEFSGILTLKNLLKKLMGGWETGDQFELNSHASIKKIDAQVFRVKGSLTLNQFNDFFNVHIEHKEIETISGYIIHSLDGFPKNAIFCQIENLYIYDIKMKRHRLDSFLVRILNAHGN